MSPLRTETACAATWVALMVDHHCTGAQGHAGAHVCACGIADVLASEQRLAERVDCLTQALRLIIDHHAPEEYRGGLTCIACTYLAGIPMSWPCVNRSFVGDLIPDASNRLLPP